MSVHVNRLSSQLYEEFGSLPSSGWVSNAITSSGSSSDWLIVSERTIRPGEVGVRGDPNIPTSLDMEVLEGGRIAREELRPTKKAPNLKI